MTNMASSETDGGTSGTSISSNVSSAEKCGDQCGHSHGEGLRLPNVFDIVKSGMLVPFQTIVEQAGVEVLKSRDDKGHTPAHWAALGGHTTILRYIIELKGPIDEPSENELRQHPIHWACVNGHVGVVDILLQVGVNIDTVDSKGCTPLIVSCQYGKTILCGYLMGKGARLQAVDKDGDTALHWAAFKGHSDLMRLLIYSGFNPHQRDNFGQTPLHLACINGNLTAVQELCEQDNVELDQADKNGKTPLMLATGRKHHNLIMYLKKTAVTKKSIFKKIDFWSLVFGPPGNSKGPLLFFVVNMLCWAYPMYLIKCLPLTWQDLEILHIIFMMLNAVMWISLYHASTTDPGFLPRNIPEYDRAIKEVAHFDEWKQGKNPLSRLCHTCRTVKPIRSKHCRICNRCVRQFDHHCPYIYNCVGIKNRVSFIIFSLTFTIMALVTVQLSYSVYLIEGNRWYFHYGSLTGAFFLGIALLLTSNTIYHAAMNLTTNERINYRRYDHLKDGKGQYYNPYDRGVWKNILEFLHLKSAIPEDDVMHLNINVV